MRRSTLAICALLTVATYGCEPAKAKLKLAWDKVRGRPTTAQAPPPPARPASDTAADRQTAEALQQAGVPRPARPGVAQSTAPARDTPYMSQDTGTVAPGMSEREVYSIWGAPVAVRRIGEYTYLFFPNGCEYSCGTMDVVTLQNGQVVDAIVRWEGHRYAGESSSPPGRVPTDDRSADPLTMPPPAPPPANP